VGGTDGGKEKGEAMGKRAANLLQTNPLKCGNLDKKEGSTPI